MTMNEAIVKSESLKSHLPTAITDGVDLISRGGGLANLSRRRNKLRSRNVCFLSIGPLLVAHPV